MKKINNSFKYNGIINSDILISGISEGNFILDNCYLIITGIHNGTINCSPNSTLEINGTLNGTVTNNGGYVKITGVINGKVKNITGEIIVDKDATIQ